MHEVAEVGSHRSGKRTDLIVAWYRAFGVALLAWGFAAAPLAAQGGPSPEEVQKVLAQDIPSDPSTVVSVVGQTPILLGELEPKVMARLDDIEKQQGRSLSEQERMYGRVMLLRSMLKQTIQSKMLGESYLLMQVGTQAADKRAEAQKMMRGRARKLFYDAQVPQMQEKMECPTLTELDKRLEQEGTSLKAVEREFVDGMLGRMYLQEMVDQDPSVSIAEIFQYYDQHRDEFMQDAQARWEQLTVLFENFPNRQAAAEALAAMGNEAIYGNSMQAVARKKSQEAFASEGGVHGWARRESIASKPLAESVFTLPIGKMSAFIEDESGLHIVKVLERKPAGLQPISEVQDDIRKQLKRKKKREAEEALVAEMKAKVPVWTIFPDDVEGAMPLQTSVARGPSATRR